MSKASINQYDDMAEYYNQLMLGGYYDYQAQAQTLVTILPPKSDILEIGAGTGLMLKELSALGYQVTGLDHTQTMLDQARILLGPNVPLIQADVTDFDLRQNYQAVLSNGGVWYGVWWEEGKFGYCGHLPDQTEILKSIRCVARHIAPKGQLILSMQDAHRNKTMDLPQDVLYEQRIHDKGEGVFDKEYIFTRKNTHEQICYQKLTLAYIDNLVFEGALQAEGFSGPVISPDKRYMVFTSSKQEEAIGNAN
jgi:SAM-dependent methyltransferase